MTSDNEIDPPFGTSIEPEDIPSYVRRYARMDAVRINHKMYISRGLSEWFVSQYPPTRGGLGYCGPTLVAIVYPLGAACLTPEA